MGALVLIDAGGSLDLLVLRYVIEIQLGMEPGHALVQVQHSAEQCVGGDGVRRGLMILYQTHDKGTDLPLFACSQRPVGAYERMGDVVVLAPCDEPATPKVLSK